MKYCNRYICLSFLLEWDWSCQKTVSLTCSLGSQQIPNFVNLSKYVRISLLKFCKSCSKKFTSSIMTYLVAFVELFVKTCAKCPNFQKLSNCCNGNFSKNIKYVKKKFNFGKKNNWPSVILFLFNHTGLVPKLSWLSHYDNHDLRFRTTAGVPKDCRPQRLKPNPRSTPKDI